MRTSFSRRRRGGRGFSLLEAMIASIIFVVGFTGLVALLLNSSTRLARASKRAVVGRMAYDEFLRFTQPGFDFIPPGAAAPGQLYSRTDYDADGRSIQFDTRVIDDCNGVPGTSFNVTALPTSQACCAGGVCCKTVSVTVTSVLNPQVAPPVQVADTYTAFVNRGCSL
ncbi:MAG: prepilin-type N-terminal cleavage/methylation domain-containing protein [Myxococcales bacterium]|nr:prepilin-type N-terminal cleavage/methylation domain-containing protein [Myxococcales bacterium]